MFPAVIGDNVICIPVFLRVGVTLLNLTMLLTARNVGSL
jgi:hypothetical protein